MWLTAPGVHILVLVSQKGFRRGLCFCRGKILNSDPLLPRAHRVGLSSLPRCIPARLPCPPTGIQLLPSQSREVPEAEDGATGKGRQMWAALDKQAPGSQGCSFLTCGAREGHPLGAGGVSLSLASLTSTLTQLLAQAGATSRMSRPPHG